MRPRRARIVGPPVPRRLTQLSAGLLLYGISDAMLLLGNVGVDPWDLFHQGLSRRFGLGVGTWALIISVVVLALWIPLRVRPGLGTVVNALVIGPIIDIVLAIFPAPHGIALRVLLMIAAVFLNAVATGAYLGAGLGAGPRDGLSTGVAARGYSFRVVRTCVELAVFAAGWALGGDVGVGTAVYALSIGPLSHFFIPRMQIADPAVTGTVAAVETDLARR